MKNKIVGEFWDRLVYKDGTIEEVEVRTNTITDGFGKVIFALLKDDIGLAYSGIQYHAIGTGTTASAQADTSLVTEVARVVPTYMNWLDSSDNLASGPTTRLLIRSDFGTGVANGSTITEQGLFAGNATATTDSGIIIDRMVHSGIAKTSDFTLQRFIKLTFS